MSFEQYFKRSEDGLQIYDREGSLLSLPENIFDDYTDIKWLHIYSTGITEWPSSFKSLSQLRGLKLYQTKFKTLPPSISTLQELRSLTLYTNSIDLTKESSKLASLPNLEELELHGYRGTAFPEGIAQLRNLKRIRIGRDLKKKLTLQQVIAVTSTLPALERLELDLPIENSDVNEEFLKLDKPLHFDGSFWPFLSRTEEWPLILSRTKHILFSERCQVVLAPFRNKFKQEALTQQQRELLFGIYIKNYTALNSLLPNTLRTATEKNESVNLILLDKPKGESAKSIREKFAALKVSVGPDAPANNIVVIGANATMEEAEQYVRKNYSFITTDHLKDVLIALSDPWLMQKDNETSNDQLLQLLASNQTENYQVAFQIIEGGGASKTIQSLLAAIMLAHPDPVIYKAAEKLYVKFGSDSFRLHAKNASASLRKSGDTDRKINKLSDHSDIEPFTFRLMHHCIAGTNRNIADVNPWSLKIKDVKDIEISRVLPFFTHIKELQFENCEGLQLEKAISLLKQLVTCTILGVNSCKISIPASISELTHLQHLDIGFNEMTEPQALKSLTNLLTLNVEGTKVKQFEWITAMPSLQSLNISNCALPGLPNEIYALTTLKKLEAKQNRISTLDPSVTKLTNLGSLDLSNNQLSAFPYFIGKLKGLNIHMLRSNKIQEFNWQQLKLQSDATSFPWTELNLSRNGLSTLVFGEIQFPALNLLDISHNDIANLDDSLFRYSALRELYGENNNISVIPPSIGKVGYFRKLWLHKNKLTRLEDYMARVRIENCDLSDNQISFIHPDFDIVGKESHGRLYWKIRNNPIAKNLNNFGGLYGHR